MTPVRVLNLFQTVKSVMSFLLLWQSLTPWISSRVRLTVKELNELPASVAESDSLDILKSQIYSERVNSLPAFMAESDSLDIFTSQILVPCR